MQRTKKIQKQPTAILTADWHLREDTPTAFTGDFQIEQWGVVTYISSLQKRYDCPVIHAGDLFNHWKPSPWLITMAMRYLPERFHTIYGNHDLPQHNLELADKCGINVLKEAGKLIILPTCHWNQTPNGFSSTSYNILVWHVMTYQGKKPWPGITDPMAAGLLRKYKSYDLILTGHNHKTFIEEYDGRLLVNPGSITRQSSDQIDHKPAVFLWYTEDNTVERVDLPFMEGVISREHIEVIEQRDARIDAFISKLNGEWQAGMSFEQNIDAFCQANNIRQPIKDIIYKALES